MALGVTRAEKARKRPAARPAAARVPRPRPGQLLLRPRRMSQTARAPRSPSPPRRPAAAALPAAIGARRPGPARRHAADARRNLAAANSFVFQGRTPLDQLRSLDCLAQAIYYEARFGERGRPARGRPGRAQPGPPPGLAEQRLRRRLSGADARRRRLPVHLHLRRLARARAPAARWDRARRLAAEALAGELFAPVGLSTHYHTSAVSPPGRRAWPTALIGAHQFLSPARPRRHARRVQRRLCRRRAAAAPDPDPLPARRRDRRRASTPSRRPRRRRGPRRRRAAVGHPRRIRAGAPTNLPESTIREEYRNSGQWRADAPARADRQPLTDPRQPRRTAAPARRPSPAPSSARRSPRCSAMWRSISAIATGRAARRAKSC